MATAREMETSEPNLADEELPPPPPVLTAADKHQTVTMSPPTMTVQAPSPPVIDSNSVRLMSTPRVNDSYSEPDPPQTELPPPPLIPDPVCGGGLKSTQPFHQEKRKGTLNGPTDTEMHGPVTRRVSREAQLQQWKEERRLKKKIEAKTKKPLFKVCHVEHGKPPSGLGHQDSASKKGKKKTKVPNPGGRVTRQTRSQTITESVEENKENPEPVTKTGSEQTGEQEHDVKYFRDLMDSERQRLNQLCKTWEGINEFGFELKEEVKGEIRTTVGQAQLLMDQRFKQFTGLVDNCEFSRGEKVTTCTDLQGFWDMIYFGVEDVDHKFEDLRKRKEGNWAEEEIAESKKPGPKKKVSAKPVKSKPVGKSKFAAFRARMVKQKKGESTVSESKASEDTVKVFDGGFFKVSSPHKTPSPHCAGGTPTKPAPPQKEVTVDSSVSIVSTETENTAPPQPQPNCQLDFSNLCTPVAANLNRTTRCRSYVPVVPSQLLCDITPSGAKRRGSYRNTPIPKKLMKTEDGSCRPSLDLPSVGGSDSPVRPKRRSRSNSNRVSFGDALTVTTVSPDGSYSEDVEPDLPETITETEKQNKGKSVSFCETDEEDLLSMTFSEELLCATPALTKGRVRSSGSLSMTRVDDVDLITFESPQKENTPTGKSSELRSESDLIKFTP